MSSQVSWCAFRSVLPIVFLGVFALSLPASETVPKVELIRTPEGGIQPQAAVDDSGTVHLIYYRGDDRAGNVFYSRRRSSESSFSKPIQVNTQSGTAIAAGTIRGAQMAVGKRGRVHVVWNGSKPASPSSHEGAPLFYTRMNEAGTAFEPERDVITFAAGLDGGSSIAADPEGNVYVAWHAHIPRAKKDEAGRGLFVARSVDDGKSFAREKLANPKPTGACACCGMRAFADDKGILYILYRAASEMVNRDEVLLISGDKGESFAVANMHPWKIATCPMSSASLAKAPHAVLAAWETEGQVYLTRVDGSTSQVSTPVAPAGSAKRKHPFAIANNKGEVLFVWTEGTGWQKGGALAWQTYDSAGKPVGTQGKQDGIPVWSFATAFANPDGNFVVMY